MSILSHGVDAGWRRALNIALVAGWTCSGLAATPQPGFPEWKKQDREELQRFQAGESAELAGTGKDKSAPRRAGGALVPVPHYPQGFGNMMCYAAACQMMLKAYGKDFNAEMWDVARFFKNPQTSGLPQWQVWIGAYEFLFSGYGLTVENKEGWVDDEALKEYLIQQLDAGKPVLSTLHHGAHAIVITGYNDAGIFINDPGDYAITAAGLPVNRGGLATVHVPWDRWHHAISSFVPLGVVELADVTTTLVMDRPPPPMPHPPVSLTVNSSFLNADDPRPIGGGLGFGRDRPGMLPDTFVMLYDGTVKLGYRFVSARTLKPPVVANSDMLHICELSLGNASTSAVNVLLEASIDDYLIGAKTENVPAITSWHEVPMFTDKQPYRFSSYPGGALRPGEHMLRLRSSVNGQETDHADITFQIAPAKPGGLTATASQMQTTLRWKPNPEANLSPPVKLKYRVTCLDDFALDSLNGANETEQTELTLYLSTPGEHTFTVAAYDPASGLESPDSDPVSAVNTEPRPEDK